MLPDIDGVDVGRRLRERGFKTAILFLTAKDGVEDKVEGFAPAATTTSPSRSRSPRSSRACRPSCAVPPATCPATSLRVRATSCSTRSATRSAAATTPIELTATEFNLLRFFMLNPRRVLSKAQILHHVWHYDFGGNPNVVETYVSYLRRSSTRSARR